MNMSKTYSKGDFSYDKTYWGKCQKHANDTWIL